MVVPFGLSGESHRPPTLERRSLAIAMTAAFERAEPRRQARRLHVPVAHRARQPVGRARCDGQWRAPRRDTRARLPIENMRYVRLPDSLYREPAESP